MAASPQSTATSGMDLRLEPFLQAVDGAQADAALVALLGGVAGTIARTIRRHGEGGICKADLEDIASEARANLLARLRRLREGGTEQPPIGDFEAYAVAVARGASAAAARRRHPRRAMLSNRLQYLLENRTSQRGFALWNEPGGQAWAGFELWRGDCSQTPDAMARRGRLTTDPCAATSEILGPGAATGMLTTHLAGLAAAVLSWVGRPLPLTELLDTLAAWQGIGGRRDPDFVSPADDHHEGPETCTEAADARPSPHDEARWREYLRWLWDETARLSLPQRTAFLLHSSCLRELELLGLASLRQAAERLELSPQQMATHWSAIPLEDRIIGSLLGVEIQRVINLRRVARDTLGRAWHRFLHGK